MKREHKNEMKARRRNIALKVAYDGTNYHGFQRQTLPVIAVQNVLEEELSKIFGDTIEMAASGRTDAGVHALGQVVNFFTNGTIPVERIPLAANAFLPDDIVVLEAWEAKRDFSARHSAKAKTYIYRVQLGEKPNPFTRKLAWYIHRPLFIEKMRLALQKIEGEHDFSSFCASGGVFKTPVRTIYKTELTKEENSILQFSIYGNGFLYHMVRNIIGTIVSVGLGRLSVDDFEAVLHAHNRQKASPTAPAWGLYLSSVEY